jgi:flagellar M-ring protein FliF
VETLLVAFKNLGPARVSVIGAVLLGMIGFFIFLVMRLGSPSMVLLYGDLSSSDSSQMITKLQGIKEKWRTGSCA